MNQFSYDCECVLVAGNGDLNVKHYAGKFDAYQRTYIIESKDSTKLSVRYLFHFMSRYVEQLRAMSIGGVIKYIKLDYLTEAKIPLPPLPEQRRIAEILDRAEALRAKRRATLTQLDTLIQALFLDLFGDPEVNPKGFQMLPLESLMLRPFQNGAYFPKSAYCPDAGVEMVHMSDAFEGAVERGNLKRVVCSRQDIKKYGLSGADLLVARRSLNYEGSVKPCRIAESNEPLIFESSLIRLTPKPEMLSVLYLYHYLSNPRVRQRFVFPFVTQSTISGINQSNLARVLVLHPPLALQREFARRVAAVEKVRKAQRASLAEMDALFASLQFRAFRGEL
ncbi:MAG: restriction endonuclease subunit S [Acidobacteria bacterium]|nr:restriction endonuclease subunit S [Acidobacteriota bacterium]